MVQVSKVDQIFRKFRRSWIVAVGIPVFFLNAPPFHIYRSLAPPHGPAYAAFAMVLYSISVTVVFVVTVILEIDPRRAILWLLAVFTAFLLGYFSLYFVLVRSVDVGKGERVSVIVGFARTEWAKQYYPGVSDVSILEQNGATEERISRAWTSSSVLLANLSLGFLFFGTIDSLFAIAMMLTGFELGGKADKHRPAVGRKRKPGS
jgi:hypothetical protein